MTAVGDRVVAAARGWLGTPYLHQASVRGAGCDCLGLLRGVWRDVVGEEPEAVPAYTWDWGEAGGAELLMQAGGRWFVPVVRDEPAVGDVLVFRMKRGAMAKHVGIQSAVGPAARFIHAYSGHGVVESALGQAWARRIAGRFAFSHGRD